MQIPGTSALIEKGTIPESVLLLTGPIGAGKTMYCRQFLVDGLLDRDYCIYVSSSLTDKQFKTRFSKIQNLNLSISRDILLFLIIRLPFRMILLLADSKRVKAQTGYH